ncbi:acyl-CoA dehydrogenase family protein [Pseudidiomarina halophila]
MDIMGPEAELISQDHDYKMKRLQNLFLFSRSDTIYAGTNQVQRNIIAERALMMPKEPRGA